MLRFLRENWLWIVLPFVVVLAGMALLLFMSNGEDSAAPFQYNVF